MTQAGRLCGQALIRALRLLWIQSLTPELIEEGFVREVVSKIQTMRKDAGFEVMDKIQCIRSAGNDKIAALMDKNAAQVTKQLYLLTDITAGEAKGFTKDWNINGEDVTLGVEKQ